MSHSSGVVVWKRDGDALSVLIQGKYKLNSDIGEILNGFPGGTGLSSESDPFVTALRELKEETGLVPKEGKVINPLMISRKHKRDGHFQFFYLVPYDDLEGNLRDKVIQDGEDLLFQPFWMPLSQLKFGLHRKGCNQIMETHKRALAETIRHFERFRLVA